MRILAIETSCDETAIAVIEATGNPLKNERVFHDEQGRITFTVLSNLVLSQVKLHAKYGGVFPSLAKREHAKNLIPLFKKALEQSFGVSGSQIKKQKQIQNPKIKTINKILEREPELLKQFLSYVPSIGKPPIDAIAVTYGPGLEPALWVGINFAKALQEIWNIPLIPINHMEGHLFSALLKKSEKEFSISPSTWFDCAPSTKLRINHHELLGTRNFQFPMMALLISGGHTELVLTKNWFEYEIVGETKDDAAGEAFDKVARMLGLPYPGGPEIAKFAKQWKSQIARNKSQTYPKSEIRLPRPMLNSGDFNFSFSGLKTAVLYTLKKIPPLTDRIKKEIAHEFQEAVADVLTEKTIRASKYYKVKTILVGGGVSANTRLNEVLTERLGEKMPDTTLYFAPRELTGDNALMIAVAGYMHSLNTPHATSSDANSITANGSMRIS